MLIYYFWCQINGIPCLCWNRESDSWVMLEWEWVKKKSDKVVKEGKKQTGKSTALHTVALYYSKKQILQSSWDGYPLCSCIRALQKPFCRLFTARKAFIFSCRGLFFSFSIWLQLLNLTMLQPESILCCSPHLEVLGRSSCRPCRFAIFPGLPKSLPLRMTFSCSWCTEWWMYRLAGVFIRLACRSQGNYTATDTGMLV